MTPTSPGPSPAASTTSFCTGPTRWHDVVANACRWLCSLLMLLYGTVKVCQAQFYADHHWLDTPLGDLTGMQLLWAMHAHSPFYETALGLVEVTLGTMLLFRRTTLLALVFLVPLSLNLVLLNVCFEVGALPTAFPLLLAGSLLLALHGKQLVRLLWDTPRPLQRIGRRRARGGTIVVAVALGLAGLVVFNNKFRFAQDPELRGAWQVVEPAGVAGAARRLYFEKGKTLVVRDAGGVLHPTEYRLGEVDQIAIVDDPTFPGFANATYRIEDRTLVLGSPTGEMRLVRIR